MELYSNSPPQFTCEGDNISPALTWTDVPKETRSFALLVEDPDAPKGTYTHWVAYNIPPDKTGLPPGAGNKPDGHLNGRNDFGNADYGGPCPPPGSDHRYFFHLFALDTMLNIPPGAIKTEVEKAMKNHILDHAQIMGRYGRH
jgi:Raf kinase inhibitor-like YbhB/YbcL family protein